MRAGTWDYTIRAYYPENAQPPKRAGGLAIETVHRGKPSRDVEIAAFKARMSRGEIAYIDVISHVEPFGIERLFS